jgi:hypothetical protein
VRTVERWDPPDNFAGVGGATWNTIIDEFDAGMPNGQRFSGANNTTDRAGWRVVVRDLDRHEKQARAVITRGSKPSAAQGALR